MNRNGRRRKPEFLPEGEPMEGRELLSLTPALLAELRNPPGTHLVRPNMPVAPYGASTKVATFVDPSVHIINGDHVLVGQKTYIAPYATLNATSGFIKIGSGSDIQDDSQIISDANHAVPTTSVFIGDSVVIGYGATVLGPSTVGAYGSSASATGIGPNAVIDGATIDPGARVRALAFVGPGAVIQPNATVGPGASITGVTLPSGYQVLPGATVTTTADLSNTNKVTKIPATVNPPASIAPTAVVTGATIQPGATVGALAYVGPGSTVQTGAVVSPTAYVGPNLTVKSGFQVLPNATVTSSSDLTDPTKVKKIQLPDVATELYNAGYLAQGYTTLYQGQSATGVTPGVASATSSAGPYNGNLANVEGASPEAGSPTVPFEPSGQTSPTFPAPDGALLPANIYSFRSRVIGGANFHSRARLVAHHLGHDNSFRADEGQPITFGSITSTGTGVTINSPSAGPLTIGQNLQAANGAVILGGPSATGSTINTVLGDNVTVGDHSVLDRSSIGANSVIGARAFIQTSTLPANSVVPPGAIIINNVNMGTVQ